MVREAIPLHHASRHWLTHHGTELSGNDWMRWALFKSNLRHVDVTFDPPVPFGDRSQQMTRTTVVTPNPSTCVTCGKFFVRERNRGRVSVNCSVRCGSVWRDAREKKPEVMTVADDRKPEIMAAERIIQTLDGLGDHETQYAVMAFVQAWLKRHQRRVGTKPNGEAAHVD